MLVLCAASVAGRDERTGGGTYGENGLGRFGMLAHGEPADVFDDGVLEIFLG